MTPNRFKSLLRQPGGAASLGTWLMSGAPAVAEALGHCGFDFLVVDLEHSPIDIAETVSLLRAIAATSAEPLVRLWWNDQILAKRVLDAGARSVMFPMVHTVEDARAAVSSVRYPPDGVRGVAGMHRASRYGREADYLKRANDGIAVVVQIEAPEAVERIEAIATVPGVDSIFLGPNDLAATMNRIGEIGHPEVQSLIARAVQHAHRAGKPIGIVAGSPDMLARFLGYGYDWAALSSDLAMLTGRADEWLTIARRSRGGAAAPVVPAAPPAASTAGY